jgi:O-acetyl-ADP-ribose deacetylase (regulator of RNase III)
VIEKQGDVFTTDATYIGHGVNCVGVMGAGIAKTIRDRYPLVYREYKAVCDRGTFRPGDILVLPSRPNNLVKQTTPDKMIVNLATQDKPGPDATYDSVFDSLFKFSVVAAQKINKYGKIIAIPEIGCGIGGLEWDKVAKIVETVEYIVPEIEYEVWHYA